MSTDNPAAGQAGELFPAGEAPVEAAAAAVAVGGERPKPEAGVSRPGRVVLAALALGIVADLLFYNNALGISVPIFTALLLGALLWLGRAEGVRPAARNLWLAVPILFFAVMVAVRANAFLAFLNVLAALILLAMLAYFYAVGRVEKLGLFGYPFIWAVSFFSVIGQGAEVIVAGTRGANVRPGSASGALRVLRGLLIALPVLVVFAGLFALADAVFEQMLNDVFGVEFFQNVWELVVQALWVGFFGFLAAGGLALALDRRRVARAEASLDAEPSAPPLRRLGMVETTTVLVAVNLLFALFVWIQFLYLFAGRTLTTLEDSEYKHYARRGFGELIIASLLTMGLILFLRWIARDETITHTRLFNMLSTLMVGFALVILASAWLRMIYWEEVADYIYTEKRLYVRVLIVWLALLFLWQLVTLWFKPERFAIGAFVVALGFLGTLDIMNPDDDVARFNIERAAVRPLYFPYLSGLSEDAVPALVAGLNSVPEAQRGELRASLQQRLENMNADPSLKGWPAFHFARQKAFDLLR